MVGKITEQLLCIIGLYSSVALVPTLGADQP